MNFILSGITIIFQLVFMGCLLFLFIRTKSAGVILIWISLLIGRIFNWGLREFYFRFLLNRPHTSEMRAIEIYSLISNISYWLILAICSFGVLLIYNEWKQGKFQSPQSIDRPRLDG